MPSDTPAATIRPAAPADLPALGRLGALLVRTHHAFDPSRFIAATPQTAHGYASFFAGQLEEPSVIILVAEREGEVAGYTYAGIEGRDYMSLRGPAGVLYDIVVDDAHRGHGVGRCCSTPRWPRSGPAAPRASCSPRRSGTSRPSACSPPPASAAR